MPTNELTAFEQAVFEQLQSIKDRLDSIEARLDSIETDVREIKSNISRIDGNIEIFATSMGFPYSPQYRRVYQFGRKVS